LDAHQVVSYKHKDAERLRVAARGAADIYEDLQYKTNGNGHTSNDEIVHQCLEKLRRLAIFSYATAKSMDEEAKSVAIKALRLPQSIKHLEEDSEPEGSLAFSPEVVEKMHQARFEAQDLRNASNSYTRGGFNNARGNHYRGRGNHFQSSARGKSFFGKPQQQPRGGTMEDKTQ
jgi:hypothetical protein